jgi:hypothetical protein
MSGVDAIGAAASSAPSATGGATPSSSAKPDAVSQGFEQLLVEQLAQEMLKTAGDSGNEYASLLPGALADAVEQGGGLGLNLGPQGTQS